MPPSVGWLPITSPLPEAANPHPRVMPGLDREPPNSSLTLTRRARGSLGLVLPARGARVQEVMPILPGQHSSRPLDLTWERLS